MNSIGDYLRAKRLKSYFKRHFKNVRLKNKYVPANCEFDFSKSADVLFDNVLVRPNCCFRIRNNAVCHFGKNVAFNNNCIVTCREKIVIGDMTNIGPNCCFFDHDHDYKSEDRLSNFVSGPIIIGNNVWIGANVIILKGTVIGDNCVIGAGSVVRGNFPQNSVIVGNPAVVKKTI